MERIRFVLDGEIVELDRVDPTRTVLQYLREDRGRCGSKEGCAEGDCGACTVVLVETAASGDSLEVRAVNACIQFLATLDGKELITVESLSGRGAALHPVQQAMVNEHGSQCGFCTPGFVMSLFALYKTRQRPSRVDIDDALAGNLCRCTGYRPIVAAAERMYALADDANAGNWLAAKAGSEVGVAERCAVLRSLEHDNDIELGDNGRRFHAPASVASLTALLSEYPDATLLAGGTDVGLWVTKQYRDLNPVIYLGRIRELATVEVTKESIDIGAAATLTEVVPVLLEHYPQLKELFLRWASPPIRNAATLVGNVANGSPIGDSMPALMAAGTQVVLCSAAGRRSVPMEAFYLGYQKKDLRPGEFVERVLVSLPAPDTVLKSYKVSKRFDQDITAVCLGAHVRFDGDRICDVRLAYGGMAATVARASGAEAALEGQSLDEAAIDAAMDAISDDFEPLSDMRASADYRRAISRNLLRRLFLELRAERQGTPLSSSVYAYGRAS
ncbi:MAG: xanthine dehydrogenase small subunit [Pseudomonadota bacterium]